MVDRETELLEVSARGGVITYNYRLVHYSSRELNPAAFKRALMPQLKMRICPAMEEFWHQGFAVVSRYRAADDKLFAELVVTGEDCENP